MMLGIETATDLVGCAIGGHEGVLAHVECARGRRHAEQLIPMIETACDLAGVQLSDIGCLAVDVGPGLFTGLRVGLATAKSLAFALRLPVVGVSSLDLVAFTVRYTNRLVVATLDAKRGEVFTAFYRQVPGGLQRIGDPAVVTPDELVGDVQARRSEVLMVGDGGLRYRELFEGLPEVEIADEGRSRPSAAGLVLLAHAQALREEFVDAADIEPIYLRKPDAEINWVTRHGRHRDV